MSDERYQLRDIPCAACGKIFVCTNEWTYKKNGKRYCSWSCYHRTVYPEGVIGINDKPPKQKPHPMRKAVLMYTADGKFIRRFTSIMEASKYLNVTSSTAVSYAASGVHQMCGGFKFRFEADGYKEGEDLPEGEKHGKQSHHT